VEDRREERKKSRNNGINVINKGFGIVMVILYIVLGITIIFRAVDIGTIPQDYARAFGVMLLFYGMFRGYKLYRRYYSGPESET
jgi:hypothetical protein